MIRVIPSKQHISISAEVQSSNQNIGLENNMMSKDQEEIEKIFIQKEKDKIFKKRISSKKEFLKSLASTHPDLALANNQVSYRRPRRFRRSIHNHA